MVGLDSDTLKVRGKFAFGCGPNILFHTLELNLKTHLRIPCLFFIEKLGTSDTKNRNFSHFASKNKDSNKFILKIARLRCLSAGKNDHLVRFEAIYPLNFPFRGPKGLSLRIALD